VVVGIEADLALKVSGLLKADAEVSNFENALRNNPKSDI
jgi:hypothetical protein